MPTEPRANVLIYANAATAAAANDWPWRLVPNETSAPTILGVGLTALQVQLRPPTTENRSEPMQRLDLASGTLILPAETALITAVPVPSAKLQHIRAAVPHLIEEWTAAELDDLHIAFGARGADGRVPVSAIDRVYLQRCISTAENAGLRVEHVAIDALLLPCAPATLTMVLDGARALLRWSAQHAGAIEIDALELFLNALLHHEDIQTLQIHAGADSEQHAALLHELIPALQRRFTVTVERHALETSLLDFLATRFAASASDTLFNLRQGEFAVPDDHRRQWRRWRPLAIVAAACLVLQIAVNLILGLTFQHQAQALRAQSENLYRELFPHDKRLVNIHQQMQAHLDASRLNGHASFALLFTQLAADIRALPSDSPPQLRGLQYDATSGALQVELVIANVLALDDLKKRLGLAHIATKVQSAVNENGALVAHISLSGD